MLSDLFSEYFKNNLRLSPLIAILIILTPLLKKRYQMKWRYWIWLMFAIYLIIPVHLFMSAISDVHTNLIWPPYSNSNIAQISNIAISPVVTVEQFVATQIEGKYFEMLPFVWLIGAAVLGSYLFIAYYVFRRDMVRWSQPIQKEEILKLFNQTCIDMNIKKSLHIVKCCKISSPMLTGLIKPTIFLPDACDNLNDLSLIFQHELTHYLRRDIWYKYFLLFAVVFNWYNPFIHLMKNKADSDIELCCDFDIIKNKDYQFKCNYSDVILSNLKKGSYHQSVLLTYFSQGKNNIRNRFINIFAEKRKKGSIVVFITLTFIIIMSITAFTERDSDPYSLNNRAYVPKNESLKELIQAKEMELEKNQQNAAVTQAGMNIVYTQPQDSNLQVKGYNTKNGQIGGHIIDSGGTAFYHNDDGKAWQLSKGEQIELNITASFQYFGGGGVIMGYIYNNVGEQIKRIKVDEIQKVSFTAPRTGNYILYLKGVSSDPTVIEGLTILKNDL